MKTYLIQYTNGNGYHCHCCRHTSTELETMEFENEESAIKFANSYNEKNTGDRDSVVTEMYELANPNPVFSK